MIWFGSIRVILSPLNSFVSKGSICCIGGCKVECSGGWWIWFDRVVTFARNPNAVNESFLAVNTWGLVGVKIFLFGVIVLSKVNLLLVLLFWVYALIREVLAIIGCHVRETTGEYFVFEDDLLFWSFVNVVEDDFDDVWLLGILLSQYSLILDELMLELMDRGKWVIFSV